jgi:hypothetical protein
MTAKPRNPNTRRIVMLLWITVAFLYSAVAYDFIIASSKDKKLEDYLQYAVLVFGDDNRTTGDVRTLVLLRADQLDLKLRGDQIAVSGNGTSLKIGVNYAVDINMPIVHRSIYTKVFQHQAVYRNIR